MHSHTVAHTSLPDLTVSCSITFVSVRYLMALHIQGLGVQECCCVTENDRHICML